MVFDKINYRISKIKRKYNDEINLFIIRRLDKPEIIEGITKLIKKKGFDIQYQLVIDIGNKKTFYEQFYSHNFKQYGNKILNDNGNRCMVIITNFIDESTNYNLKWKIRKKYQSNIIHASDSPKDANNELKLLLKRDKLDFYQIGTTWSRNNYANDIYYDSLNKIEW